jgi:hypothetical protein
MAASSDQVSQGLPCPRLRSHESEPGDAFAIPLSRALKTCVAL